MEQLHPSLIVQRTLEGGESLMWAGRPKQGLMLHGTDAMALAAGLMWVVLAAIWVWNAYEAGAAPQQLLISIPFAVYGLYLLTGRFVVDLLRRRHMLYGLTDRRALIIVGWRRQRVVSFPLREIEAISWTRHRDGTGTIVFGAREEVPLRLPGRRAGTGTRVVGARFEAIPRPRYVHDMFHEAWELARKAPAETGRWGTMQASA